MFELLMGKKRNYFDLSSGYGIFGGGHKINQRTLETGKYSFASSMITSGSSLSLAREDLSAVGNSTVALFGGGLWGSGGKTDLLERYTHASQGVATTTKLSRAVARAGAIGNDTLGLFASGEGSGKITSTHIYSDYTTRASGLLTREFSYQGVLGINEYAMLIGGMNSQASSNKYVYSSETAALGTALSLGRHLSACFGNTAFGVLSGGNRTGSQKYTYASAVFSATDSLGVHRSNLFGIGNSDCGIVLGGNSAIYFCEKYNYSTETFSQSTYLGYVLTTSAGCSSSPGHY